MNRELHKRMRALPVNVLRVLSPRARLLRLRVLEAPDVIISGEKALIAERLQKCTPEELAMLTDELLQEWVTFSKELETADMN